MADYIRIPFADNASGSDKVAIDTSTQPDGKVSMQSGYGTDYSRNPQTDVLAKKIERSKINWLFNLITKVLQKYQQTGVPDFITSAENNGSPFSYAKYAQVIKGGVIYESLEDGNTDTPPSVKWRNASINDNITELLNGTTIDLSAIGNVILSSAIGGGLEFKFGHQSGSYGENTDPTVTFASAFAGQCVFAMAIPLNESGSNTEDYWYQLKAIAANAVTFKFQGSVTLTPATRSFYWFAIGY